MSLIVPAVLAKTKEEFVEKITDQELRPITRLWQIDILDGSMFEQTSWAQVEEIAEIENLPDIELHLMIEDPVAVVKAWHANIPTLKRAIIHAEISQSIEETLTQIKELGIEAGVAVNPETSIKSSRKIIDQADVLLIMGVQPGKSGQSFLGNDIIIKIAQARDLFPEKLIAVDGGITIENAAELLSAGVDQLCVGSTLWNSSDKKLTFNDLLK